jgi:hypothetical protein
VTVTARWLARVLLVAAVGCPAPLRLVAQDTTAVRPRADSAAARPAPAAPGNLALHTSPMNAFWRSFLVPGWGQAKLGRKLTAGIFIGWEGTTLGMSLKTRHELAYLRRTGSARAEDKRREHEDWLVLLGFNHLFAGLEAYVSAHLTDFPGDLRLEALPGGGVGGAVSLPVRIP